MDMESRKRPKWSHSCDELLAQFRLEGNNGHLSDIELSRAFVNAHPTIPVSARTIRNHIRQMDRGKNIVEGLSNVSAATSDVNMATDEVNCPQGVLNHLVVTTQMERRKRGNRSHAYDELLAQFCLEGNNAQLSDTKLSRAFLNAHPIILVTWETVRNHIRLIDRGKNIVEGLSNVAAARSDVNMPTDEVNCPIFLKYSMDMPIFKCESCNRLWFANQMLSAATHLKNIMNVLAGTPYHATSNICTWCNKHAKGKVSRNIIMNVVPPSVKDLSDLEERLISIRIPFARISLSDKIIGHKRLHGGVIHVAANVESTQVALPRFDDEHAVVRLVLKRRMSDTSSYMEGGVRPLFVMNALNELINSTLYRSAAIVINNDWKALFANRLHLTYVEDAECSDSHPNFDTVSETLMWNFTLDMISDYEDKTIVVAPCEGSSPLGFYNTPYVEEKCFPTLFGGELDWVYDSYTYKEICQFELTSAANLQGIT